MMPAADSGIQLHTDPILVQPERDLRGLCLRARPMRTISGHWIIRPGLWPTFRISEGPPSAPTNLTATAVSPVRINLSWTDTSNNETGFRIERRIVAGSWSPLATVGANTTSYPDTSATPETPYYYRVIAYNAPATRPPATPPARRATHHRRSAGVHGHIIDDDNAGGTSDDDNGYVNCGETVGLTVMLQNEGNTAVEGINTTLSIVGGTGAVTSPRSATR